MAGSSAESADAGAAVGMVIVSMMATAMVFAAAFEVIAHPSFRRG
ncbi:hypothetical protein [Mycobacteroides abscessus]|nr:hypothetical protein [Mycobacteroides abscessus]